MGEFEEVEGDGAPCKYCGKPCEPLSAMPSRWPVYLPDIDKMGSGKGRYYHIGCVVKTLAEIDHLRAQIAEKGKEIERLKDEAVRRILDTPDDETIARAVKEYDSAEAAVKSVENTEKIVLKARADAAEAALREAEVGMALAISTIESARSLSKWCCKNISAAQYAADELGEADAWDRVGNSMFDGTMASYCDEFDQALASLPSTAKTGAALIEAALEETDAENSVLAAADHITEKADGYLKFEEAQTACREAKRRRQVAAAAHRAAKKGEGDG